MNTSRACCELAIIGVSEHGSIEFPAFEILSPCRGDEVDFSHGNHHVLSFSTFTVLLLVLPFRASHFATRGRGKRKITSRYMIARIGCPEGSVDYAFSLASSLRVLCRSAAAFAIKTAMMTDAISIALPTEFLALHTKSYASRCLFLEIRLILPFSLTVYIFGLSIFIPFLIARNIAYDINKTLYCKLIVR